MSSQPTTPDPDVIIIGAGPAGCLLALLLSKSTPRIHIYDYRPDPRLPPPPSHPSKPRSINLALSTRGLTALSAASLAESVTAAAVPMHGRCIHTPHHPLHFHPYGQHGQHLLSVSRHRLNNLLLDRCDTHPNIRLAFRTRCLDVDLDTPSVTLRPEHATADLILPTRLVVGADGAYSRVRACMIRRGRFDFSQSYVNAVYKELAMTVPNELASRFPSEWLHIWPRHRFMLIALPNERAQFTSTLFMDKEEMDRLQTPQQIVEFFSAHFPDVLDVMPNLVDHFQKAPAPPLLTVRCQPYNYKGNAVLIGDAAHAIVPFYGQGCNAAFEDCRLLADKIQQLGWRDLPRALAEYSRERKVHADAIADLAIDHYEDMSSRSARPLFVLRRRLEIMLNRFFPQSFLPLYTMISFSNIPYAHAVQRALEQDRWISSFLMTLGIATVSATALVAGRANWVRFMARR